MEKRKSSKTNRIGVVLFVIAVALFAVTAYLTSGRHRETIIFSEKELINNVWLSYKREYLEDGNGRTLDKQRDNITTSEGQSYTLLRAVWLDDRETFDSSLQWTKDNLQHDTDKLFSWLFGRRSDGSYDILVDRGGQNSASDADVDIALALIFAYARWDEPGYLADARAIMADIWENEVIMVNGRPVLAANNVEQFSPNRILVNPSYFAPYAYRIFEIVDPERDWEGLIDTSYSIIQESMGRPLDKNSTAYIPPDWIIVNRTTGAITAPDPSTNLTTNYSFDAMRLPWRLALDWKWYGEERARNVLSQMDFFSREWQRNKALKTSYAHDGQAIGVEAPAVYGGTMGYFVVVDPEKAKDIFRKKLAILYSSDTNTWKQTLSYYDDNWAWFGIALHGDLLPNLATLLPDNAAQEAR